MPLDSNLCHFQLMGLTFLCKYTTCLTVYCGSLLQEICQYNTVYVLQKSTWHFQLTILLKIFGLQWWSMPPLFANLFGFRLLSGKPMIHCLSLNVLRHTFFISCQRGPKHMYTIIYNKWFYVWILQLPFIPCNSHSCYMNKRYSFIFQCSAKDKFS
jgi:hypothetical protein